MLLEQFRPSRLPRSKHREPAWEVRRTQNTPVPDCVCVCSVWVPCVALPSGGGSSVGPSPLCGSPVWVPCVGPLCGSPVWVPCVGPSSRCVPCVIYSREVSRSFTRSRSDCACFCQRNRSETGRTLCKGSQQGGTIKGSISAATLNRFVESWLSCRGTH